MAHPVSAKQILALRLRSLRIDPIGTGDVAGTVRHLLATQAQDFGQAAWAIGLRSPGTGRSDVLAALERGEVVRSLPMRGTLHFVASEDLRWMLDLTAQRMLQSAGARFAALGLDRQTLDAAEGVTRAALAGGGSLSREEFMALLSANGIAPDGQRGYHVIFYLCQLAVICWGPPSGTQQAIVLVDEWIPATPDRDRDEALASFALRFFASHGPATERDLAWWTKLTLRDVRAAIASLGDRLTTLSHEGIDYLIATDALADGIPAAPRPAVQALPGFDEYLLGYQDRSLALETEHAWRIVPGNNGVFFPMIVSRGEVVGSWRRNPKTSIAEPDYFLRPTASQLVAFGRAAKKFERFTSG
ncbi:MAG TPA: winged helix DNA-binding domain-containing protein [Galbitalea sp.]|nr:winged helix DNA-binding domain-containing protein [Galbitalea sp.]